MQKNQLIQILNDQKIDFLAEKDRVVRDIDLSFHLKSNDISVITGIRRCGKSTLLQQIRKSYKGFNFHYIDFEDPRLGTFSPDDFELCSQIWEWEKAEGKTVLFIDEVQNITGWERWIRYFAEKRGYKLFITGSNSELLSSELGSVLSGRYITVELFPFSIKEVAHYTLGDLSKHSRSTSTHVNLQKILEQVMRFGLFPRPFLEQSTKIYPTLFENIVTRDIAQRKKIRRQKELFEFATLVARDNTRVFNIQKTSQLLQVKDERTIGRYGDYLEEAYLAFKVRKFSSSRRKALRGFAKYYLIDPILADCVSMQPFRATNFLENLVFVDLRRQNLKFGYWTSSNGYEVDFIIERAGEGIEALQVSYELSSPNTVEREVRSLLAAKRELGVKSLKIITYEPCSEDVRKLVPKEIDIVTYLQYVGLW